MSKKCYRFYAGLLRSQTRWLNRMAAQGYRLIRTGKTDYEFEPCKPNEYEYCVEYIGGKSYEHAKEYKHFLEDMGYRTFYKNINLNYSAGKVYLRPWAEKGSKIGTASTTLNKELLIVEKKNDGTPFELHTTYEDQLKYMKSLRKPWLVMLGIFLIFWLMWRFLVFGIFTLLFLIPVVLYQIEIIKLGKEAKTKEW